jgi:hypothetical protein
MVRIPRVVPGAAAVTQSKSRWFKIRSLQDRAAVRLSISSFGARTALSHDVAPTSNPSSGVYQAFCIVGHRRFEGELCCMR